jgi:DNA-binding response OmpR family regulator
VRILLVEDDEMIGRSLSRSLRDDSYAVDWVHDGAAATRALSVPDAQYSLVLLDWSLPQQSGIEVLRTMRQRLLGTPVLMLTARDRIEDRVLGLDAGADDYLVKPFSLEELRARMRSLLRRGIVRPDSTLASGTLRLDMVTKRVTLGDQQIEVTARELALLRVLLQNPGAVLSRRELEEQIYGWGEEVASGRVPHSRSAPQAHTGHDRECARSGLAHQDRAMSLRGRLLELPSSDPFSKSR